MASELEGGNRHVEVISTSCRTKSTITSLRCRRTQPRWCMSRAAGISLLPRRASADGSRQEIRGRNEGHGLQARRLTAILGQYKYEGYVKSARRRFTASPCACRDFRPQEVR